MRMAISVRSKHNNILYLHIYEDVMVVRRNDPVLQTYGLIPGKFLDK